MSDVSDISDVRSGAPPEHDRRIQSVVPADPRAGVLWLAWDTSPALVAIVQGPDHVLAYQNLASQEMFGARTLGTPLIECFPELTAAGVGGLDEVLATGRPLEFARRVVGVRDVAGDEVVMRYVLAPYAEPGAAPTGVVITALDASAEARWEQSSIRNRLIADLAEGMNNATDPLAALHILAEALVPAVADLAAVFVTDPVASSPRAPQRPAALVIAPSLTHLGAPPDPAERDAPSPWQTVLAAGETVLIPVGADEGSGEGVGEPATQEWLRGARANGLAVVPLAVAGGLSGALVLLTAADRPAFTDQDVPFLEAIAARGGAAVAHVQALRQQRQIAVSLQRALLPAAPPAMPDISVAAAYVAGAQDVEVGGDWWDVVELGAGRLAAGVGDVSGRGLSAAVVMGQARAAMRTAGLANLEPSEVLSVLDVQVAELVPVGSSDQGAPPRFATAAYAVFEPSLGCLRVVSAGHPPLLVCARGQVAVVNATPGAPLGLMLGGWEETRFSVSPDSIVALFTDGLVESRTQDLDEGYRSLSEALAAAAGMRDLNEMLESILESTGRAHGHEDDIVLVLMRITAAAFPTVSYDTDVDSLAEIGTQRSAVIQLLSRGGVPQLLADDVGQVLSELLANALEHGHGQCHLHAHLTAARIVLEVTDRAFLTPVPLEVQPDAERGRGITVTDALATHWGARFSPRGKTVWAEFGLNR